MNPLNKLQELFEQKRREKFAAGKTAFIIECSFRNTTNEIEVFVRKSAHDNPTRVAEKYAARIFKQNNHIPFSTTIDTKVIREVHQ